MGIANYLCIKLKFSDMLQNLVKRIFLNCFLLIATFSCVSPKVHSELQESYNTIVDENQILKSTTDRAETNLKEISSDVKVMRMALETLISDSISEGRKYRKLKKSFDDLNANYQYAINNNSSLVAANLRENKIMLEQMESLAKKLGAKEDSLKLEQSRLINLELALQSRERRVNELESLIARKDSTAQYFRKRIGNALLGFENRGLTVSMKNGQVYVSLDNRLMFASGKWEIQLDGVSALQKLAQVLGENQDLNIAVEGHTDDDAYYGKGQVRDNWDLSVMRATSVVKILIEKGVAAKQIQATGRGEFMPIVANNNADNKAKNRRTEIIITPDLGEIADLISK
jgi:chemotaxis protein MotB